MRCVSCQHASPSPFCRKKLQAPLPFPVLGNNLPPFSGCSANHSPTFVNIGRNIHGEFPTRPQLVANQRAPSSDDAGRAWDARRFSFPINRFDWRRDAILSTFFETERKEDACDPLKPFVHALWHALRLYSSSAYFAFAGLQMQFRHSRLSAVQGQPRWDLNMKEDRASVDVLFVRGPRIYSIVFGTHTIINPNLSCRCHHAAIFPS